MAISRGHKCVNNGLNVIICQVCSLSRQYIQTQITHCTQIFRPQKVIRPPQVPPLSYVLSLLFPLYTNGVNTRTGTFLNLQLLSVRFMEMSHHMGLVQWCDDHFLSDHF